MKYIILLLLPISIFAQDYKSLLIKEEGYKNILYKDSRDNLTVGIGHLIIGPHKDFYTNKEINDLFDKDLSDSISICNKFYKDFNNLDDDKKLALVSLAFQLGETKLKLFIKFNRAVNENNMISARKELTDSKLMIECPNRTKELIKLLTN